MNPDLAVGAVLDVGIYPLFLHRFLLGEIESLDAMGHLAPAGVEDAAAFLTRHESGAVGSSLCSFTTEEAMDAVISGTEGEIRLPRFHARTKVSLWRDGEEIDRIEDASGGRLRAEIEAVIDSLLRGESECPGHWHSDSLALARWMDEIRNQLGAV